MKGNPADAGFLFLSEKLQFIKDRVASNAGSYSRNISIVVARTAYATAQTGLGYRSSFDSASRAPPSEDRFP